MSQMCDGPGLVTADQVVPSVVRMTVPLRPDAQATLVSTADTAVSRLPVGEACCVQLAPRLVVLKITPPLPTAQAVVWPAVSTPCRVAAGVRACSDQVVPSLVLVATVPALPTATAVWVSQVAT